MIYFTLRSRIEERHIFPQLFKRPSSQFPVANARGNNIEHVSFLSETDQAIQLNLSVSIQSRYAFHSGWSIRPSPDASIPAHSETKIGIPLAIAASVRSRNHFLWVPA